MTEPVRSPNATSVAAAAAISATRRSIGEPVAREQNVLDLPIDYARPAQSRFRHAPTPSFDVAAHVAHRLNDLARDRTRSMRDLLLAAWLVVLHRYTGAAEIDVGVRVPAGEGGVDAALRVDCAGDPTFVELAARVHIALRQAAVERSDAVHATVAFDAPERDAAPPRNGRRGAPLTEVELVLRFQRSGASLSGAIDYATELFAPETARRIGDHVGKVLESASSAPDESIRRLALLPDAEWRALVVERNATQLALPRDVSISGLIEAQVGRSPERDAAWFEGRALTYRELDRCANRLARHLIACGVGIDRPAAVLMERSIDSVVAMLAVFKAGGIYVPLDPTYPRDRLQHMIADSAAAVVVTHGALVKDVAASSARTIDVGADARDIAQQRGEALGIAVAPGVGSYVIFTSGSTGKPKGVVLTQRGLVNFVCYWKHAFPLGGSDRVLVKTSCGFDPSMIELLWPLVAGATLVIARPGGERDGAYLVQLIREQRITAGFAVPAALLSLARERGFERCTSLRTFFTGGEPVSTAVVRAFEAGSSARLYNIYGPAEATCTVATGVCEVQDDARTVPFGKAIGNTQLYVLDAHLEPVPTGVPGELWIGGLGVGRGYIGRPALTASRFLPDPFGKEPGGRLYRTGDVVRYRRGGVLEFVGRTDSQVKIRGYRIELGEIESVLRTHPAIVDAAVCVHTTKSGDKQLVAHLIASGAQRPTRDDLHAFLRGGLPDYMLPAHAVYHERFPTTLSGKLKRDALPPPPERTNVKNDYVAPRTTDEFLLAEIWKRVLGVEDVGATDNFFDLGGHSLSAVETLRRIREAYGIDFGLHHFLLAPTIEAIARAVAEQSPTVPPA